MVNFKARDGLDLQGILIRPVGEKKGRKVPLILMAHGGPESHYKNGWMTYYSWLGQMAAGKDTLSFIPITGKYWTGWSSRL